MKEVRVSRRELIDAPRDMKEYVKSLGLDPEKELFIQEDFKTDEYIICQRE